VTFLDGISPAAANLLIATTWKRAHLLHRNAGTTNLSQSELACLKENCVAATQFNFIIAARVEASRALLTRLGCDRLLGLPRQTY